MELRKQATNTALVNFGSYLASGLTISGEATEYLTKLIDEHIEGNLKSWGADSQTSFNVYLASLAAVVTQNTLRVGKTVIDKQEIEAAEEFLAKDSVPLNVPMETLQTAENSAAPGPFMVPAGAPVVPGQAETLAPLDAYPPGPKASQIEEKEATEGARRL